MKKSKRNRRTRLAVLLTACVLTPLTGCSGTPDDTEDGGANAANTAPLTADYTINADTGGLTADARISDTLYGLFLEDINYAVDAGLYAELIKNRSFEYGSAAAGGAQHGWVNDYKEALDFTVADGSADGTALNANNPNYAVLTNSGLSSQTPYPGISNLGYLDGLAVTKDAAYSASFYIRNNPSGDPAPSTVQLALCGSDGTIYAEELVKVSPSDTWSKYEAVLTPSETVSSDLRFYIGMNAGSACLDMISLMPEDTFADLPVRKDLGEYLAELNPSFLRFPGGCVIEGRDAESIYNWKDSVGGGLEFAVNGNSAVGDVATRPQGKDIWNGSTNNPYYTTYGLGFYEYFCLSEALGAIPLPILNAGMTCQIQSAKYLVYALDSEELAQYIQDALDLVEFCRGDGNTKWGAVRIAMGHEEPFDLKYIGIGNEQWQNEYHLHYEKFVKAFEQAAKENPALYGDIELIVANGPSSGSTEGWSYVEDFPDDLTTLVDEHYYEAPDWFLRNTTRYDSYDRTSPAKVFLGEYAAQSNTLKAALSEAAYMTGLERNGDIVAMACYAPLLGNATNNQWVPDMIFFNNHTLYGTPNYYVQKLFAGNAGTTYLDSALTFDESASQQPLSGGIGLGSWQTSVAYDNLTVTANAGGKVLYKSDFDSENTISDDGWNINEGDWSVSDGRLVQTNTGDPFDANTGDAIYIGDENWSDYTMTVDAEILSGNEGFLIPVCVKNTSNNIFWNLGGWGNTVSCLQIVENNAKSGQVSGTVKPVSLKHNQTYQIKVEVSGNQIKCYLDETLYIDYTVEPVPSLFASTVMDDNGDIIVKIVNLNDSSVETRLALEHFDTDAYDLRAKLYSLSGADLSMVNDFDNPEAVAPVETELAVSSSFTYKVPKYSLTVMRIRHK